MKVSLLQRSAADNFEIKVPASIANLGPGFDTLAVAVQLYLSLRVRKMPGRGHLEFRFLDHELRGENCIERAYRSLAGEDFSRLPSLSVEVRSEIPMRAGLGSSAAATVAGLRLYEAVSGPLPMETLLSAACALESHPDNAAASLLGGLTLSCQLPDGLVQAQALLVGRSRCAFVVLTPEVSLATGESRGGAAGVSFRAPMSSSISSELRCCCSRCTAEISRCCGTRMRDRVHQPARKKVVPGLARALELEHPDLLGVCLSGSGPSIVAIAERSHREIGELLGSVYQRSGVGYRIRTLEAHQELSEHVPLFRSGLLCC